MAGCLQHDLLANTSKPITLKVYTIAVAAQKISSNFIKTLMANCKEDEMLWMECVKDFCADIEFFFSSRLHNAKRTSEKKKFVPTNCGTFVEKHTSKMEDENANFSDFCVIGIKTELVKDEKALEEALYKDALGVVFQDDVSYQLKFPAYRVVSPNDLIGDIDYCYNYSSPYCSSPRYWFEGFVSLQSSIDSALIEQITNHSVWDEMKSISGIRMRSPSITPTNNIESCVFFFAVIVCFSPFMYFLSQNVSREKRKLKEVMKTMGLRDTAFWLSWSLLYAIYIIITSSVMASFLNHWYFTWSSFSALFLLFLIYGISSVSIL
ncbi:hypothetical protein JD844_011312 [Phrynosoma platyrhinos]|uniref:ABC-2 type transporter transmembrane domain-containing protein n=1 Tax=Phrynosoma platyrhinos TaxID=52577 RepID=A0ABQ7TI59_PHRPL|nr:hypothetical protein JD844_011312 [Phrynosoma platyrhinos]